MEIAEIAAFVTQFGTPGIMVAYLIWREREERKYQREKDRFDREEAEKDRELAKDCAAADLEMATAMTLLTATIQGMR